MLRTLLGWIFPKVIETISSKVEKVTEEVAKEPDNSHLQYTKYETHNTWFDVLIDGVGRAIRPGITIWLFGGLAGAWRLPSPNEIDPVMFELTIWTMGFWFGHRAIAKDLPMVILSLKKAFRE